jgi:UDP-N-acetylglucosamine 1-carboxyvinyltransferase
MSLNRPSGGLMFTSGHFFFKIVEIKKRLDMSGLFIPEYIEINGRAALNPDASIDISGAKNEVLGAMAAAVLSDQPIEFTNMPHISDVLDMGRIMLDLGIDVQYDPESKLMRIHAEKIISNQLSDEAYKFRASYYLWGALLSRFANTGEFDSLKIKLPGGCSFSGNRPTDYHTSLMQNIFDVEIKDNGDELEFVLPRGVPADDPEPIFATDLMSHGATLHWLLSVAASPQAKMYYNASLEPEVPHLLTILNKMGANLRGTGTTGITSMGRKGLLNGGRFEIMPDRMETASYVLLGMAMRDKISINGTNLESCRPWLNSVLEIMRRESLLTFCDCPPAGDRCSFDFRKLADFPGQRFLMSPFPGKETDLHQIWAAALASASSMSEIHDPVWPGRKDHLPEMAKFGIESTHALYETKSDRVVARKTLKININPSQIKPANATGMDLRGTFGLIVCAAAAPGQSRIDKPGFALRGYPNLIRNLQNIGIDVRQSEAGRFLPPLPPIQ